MLLLLLALLVLLLGSARGEEQIEREEDPSAVFGCFTFLCVTVGGGWIASSIFYANLKKPQNTRHRKAM